MTLSPVPCNNNAGTFIREALSKAYLIILVISTYILKKIILTPKEFSIVELLLRHKDEVVTRTMITEHVWDYNFEGMSNVVDVFVGSLRRKIDKPSFHTLIYTIHGVGYKMSETP